MTCQAISTDFDTGWGIDIHLTCDLDDERHTGQHHDPRGILWVNCDASRAALAGHRHDP